MTRRSCFETVLGSTHNGWERGHIILEFANHAIDHVVVWHTRIDVFDQVYVGRIMRVCTCTNNPSDGQNETVGDEFLVDCVFLFSPLYRFRVPHHPPFTILSLPFKHTSITYV